MTMAGTRLSVARRQAALPSGYAAARSANTSGCELARLVRAALRRSQIGELRVAPQEGELRCPGRAVAVLREDDLRDALLVGLLAEVVLVAVDEEDEVRVLLEASGLAEVGEDRSLVVPLLDGTRELREGEDRDL